jgi:hypothetical protein
LGDNAGDLGSSANEGIAGELATGSENSVDNGKHLLDDGDQLVLDPTLVVGISGERKRSRAHCKFVEFDSDI